MPAEKLTIRDAVAKGATYLKEKGMETPRLDAELLVGEALGLDRLQLYLRMDQPLNEDERLRARELLRRRAAHEPVAYILGRREFRSRDFEVKPGVLIPRPETELLVEHSETNLARRFPDCGGAWRVLEFGVGCGAIGISLAADLPGVHVVGTDISEPAVAMARSNAVRHGVADRIEFRVQPDFAGIEGGFHCLVANPPYIARKDAPAMTRDVIGYEPEVALFAEDDGQYWINYLLATAPPLLVEGGFFACEFGYAMEDRVADAARALGWSDVEIHRDYVGIERHIIATRPPTQ
jgi:release factor glutamine methyltransferase